MAEVSVIFVTVCGGATREEVEDEYNYLLGSIEHHAEIGSHVVVDTSPPEYHINFTRLPNSVCWVYEPVYGFGTDKFRMWSAMKRAMAIAEELKPDIVVHLDCDEFYSIGKDNRPLPEALKRMVEVETYEWRQDGKAYSFGTWHRRMWPGRAGVTMGLNVGWQEHPAYNGNPENHPFPVPSEGMGIVRIEGLFHHHISMAVGGKLIRRGGCDIPWWPPHAGAGAVKWPERLERWRSLQEPPLEGFR